MAMHADSPPDRPLGRPSFVRRVRVAVEAMTGWRRAAAAFVAGSLSVLAFAPVYLSPVLFLTLPVFVWLLDGARTRKSAAVTGWWFAFGYFFFNLFWIGEAFLVEADKFAWLLPFAVTMLPAGLALFWALAAALTHSIWPEGYRRVLVFAGVFSIAEWVRGHIFTGLPWNVPGYALTAPTEMMQSAGVFGIYGLTLLALIIFTMPLVVIADTETSTRRVWAGAGAIAVLPLALLWGYGAWQMRAPQTFVEGVKIRIVQPSVLQTEKWRPEHQRRIFDDHLTLSQTAPNGTRDDLAGITHVIWPEAAMPFFPLESERALSEIAAMMPDGRTLITGAIRRDLPPGEATQQELYRAHVFNSILVFDDAARPIATYDKIHLVPFGEYLPADGVLSAIGLKKLTHGRGAFTPGTEPRQLMSIPGLPPVLGLVCYEVLFPNEVVQSSERPGLIVNVTNDGWFGNTSGPRQHFHQTRVRAVEQGVPVLRAANNGISGMIDPNGRVVAALWMNERGVADSYLPKAKSPPLFARYGDAIFGALLAIVGVVALRGWPRFAR